MVRSSKANGEMASSMAKVKSLKKMELRRKDSGMKGRESKSRNEDDKSWRILIVMRFISLIDDSLN